MSREETEFYGNLRTLQLRCDDLQHSIGALFTHLEEEHENIQLPKFLDHFSIIVGNLKQIGLVTQQLGPSLRSRVLAPVKLSEDRDERLAYITRNRVPVLSHKTAPDLLKIKTEPKMEKKYRQFNTRSAVYAPDVSQTKYETFIKKVTLVWVMLAKGREELRKRHAKPNELPMTSRLTDTHALLVAVGNGDGLVEAPVAGPSRPKSRQKQSTLTVAEVMAMMEASIKPPADPERKE